VPVEVLARRRLGAGGLPLLMGGGGPQAFTGGADKARQAWREAGRAGAPRLAALAYVSLGEDAEAHARAYLTDYYSFIGEFAKQIAAFTEAGRDELILFPCHPDTAQVALTAQAAGL
jgi:alkanesulfonate monooxygenase SsuD/methylene tetrahydromethanopterin reductase-like flavin-dependent oxidoreductase (luciferase family)